MKVDEITDSPLRYGDEVKIKDAGSKYSGLIGKVVEITSLSAKVKFDEMKKPMTIMLTALEKT